MKDQHTLISGYRDLNQEEIDLMNEIKQMEARVLVLVNKCKKKIAQQYNNADNPDSLEAIRAELSRAIEWANTGHTELEKGFMALVRSVAQPQPTEIK